MRNKLKAHKKNVEKAALRRVGRIEVKTYRVSYFYILIIEILICKNPCCLRKLPKVPADSNLIPIE